MQANKLTDAGKWYITIIAGLLFLLLSSQFMYGITNGLTSMINVRLTNSKGCPAPIGILLHTIIFILIFRLLMQIPMKRKEYPLPDDLE